MQKLNIEIDVTKISRDRLVERSYTKRDGTSVTEKNLKAVVILNKDNVLKEGPTWVLKEVGFVAEDTGKDGEKNYIGRVTTFEEKKPQDDWDDDITSAGADYPADDINPEDIPF